MVLYGTRQSTIMEAIWQLEECRRKGSYKDKHKAIYSTFVKELIQFAHAYGFHGNLYHGYLTHFLVTDENPFSYSCERNEQGIGNLQQLAEEDCRIFQWHYAYDFYALDELFGTFYAPVLTGYEPNNVQPSCYPQGVVRAMEHLAKELASCSHVEEFVHYVKVFYGTYGVGEMGLHMAFRIGRNAQEVALEPIAQVEQVQLEDLIGYDIPKQKLIENTESFLAGKKANNCLLFGDAGTGKSSSIKGILNEYYSQGLRMIEVYKHEFQSLNEVVALLRNRNYKFIIYMDDLSFEEFEIDYKYLKAVIEGGLEDKADNVLIYATSNRRHLIRENFRDKEEYQEDLHGSDTVQEKLSLAARFGVSIYFGAPSRKEFHEIVKGLAKRYHLEKSEEELCLEANQWELAHGGLSGRTAQQFMNYLLGKQG